MEDGYYCSGEPSSCSSRCGDGIFIQPFEQCDDGNLKNGDGCNAQCFVEKGYACDHVDGNQICIKTTTKGKSPSFHDVSVILLPILDGIILMLCFTVIILWAIYSLKNKGSDLLSENHLSLTCFLKYRKKRHIYSTSECSIQILN